MQTEPAYRPSSETQVILRWGKLVGTIIIVLAVLFTIFRYGRDFSAVFNVSQPWISLYALPLTALTFFLHALLWNAILRRTGSRLSFWNGIYIYFFSGLSRYIPGTYWYIGARGALAAEAGVAFENTISATAAEMLIKLVSGCILLALGAALGLAFDASQLVWIAFWVILAIFGYLLVNRLFKDKFTSSGRFKDSLAILKNTPLGILAGWTGAYFAAWIIQGMALFACLSTWISLDIHSADLVILSYVLAFISGLVNPFTPNGIGSREAVLIVTLSTIIHAPVVIAASMLMRMYILAAEAAWSLISWLILRVGKKKPAQKNTC